MALSPEKGAKLLLAKLNFMRWFPVAFLQQYFCEKCSIRTHSPSIVSSHTGTITSTQHEHLIRFDYIDVRFAKYLRIVLKPRNWRTCILIECWVVPLTLLWLEKGGCCVTVLSTDRSLKPACHHKVTHSRYFCL